MHFTIHGIGYFVRIFHSDHQLYQAVKEVNNSQLDSMILDSSNLQKLDLTYSTHLDIIPDEFYIFYLADPISRLEIKTPNKRHKLFFKDLVRSDLLFPSTYIYNTSIFSNPTKSLVIQEEDMGNFGQCKIEAEFNSSLLKMEIVKYEKAPCIGKIYYNGIPLNFNKTDTLNRSIQIKRY